MKINISNRVSSGNKTPKPIKGRRKGKERSRFDVKSEEKEPKRVWVRKRVKTPFPTNYLPTLTLKISAVLRYYQFKADIKRAERGQRKERDIETSKYSILTSYLEKEVDTAREEFIRTGGESPHILVFKVHEKFDGVLGRTIKYLSIQDKVEVISMNSNYDKITTNPPPRLIMVELNQE